MLVTIGLIAAAYYLYFDKYYERALRYQDAYRLRTLENLGRDIQARIANLPRVVWSNQDSLGAPSSKDPARGKAHQEAKGHIQDLEGLLQFLSGAPSDATREKARKLVDGLARASGQAGPLGKRDTVEALLVSLKESWLVGFGEPCKDVSGQPATDDHSISNGPTARSPGNEANLLTSVDGSGAAHASDKGDAPSTANASNDQPTGATASSEEKGSGEKKGSSEREVPHACDGVAKLTDVVVDEVVKKCAERGAPMGGEDVDCESVLTFATTTLVAAVKENIWEAEVAVGRTTDLDKLRRRLHAMWNDATADQKQRTTTALNEHLKKMAEESLRPARSLLKKTNPESSYARDAPAIARWVKSALWSEVTADASFKPPPPRCSEIPGNLACSYRLLGSRPTNAIRIRARSCQTESGEKGEEAEQSADPKAEESEAVKEYFVTIPVSALVDNVIGSDQFHGVALADSRGNVIYATAGFEGLTEVPDLSSEGETEDETREDFISRLLRGQVIGKAPIAGSGATVYSNPIALGLVDEAIPSWKRHQGGTWLVIGFASDESRPSLLADAHLPTVRLLVFLVLVGFCAWPLLRLRLIGPLSAIPLTTMLRLTAASFLGVAIATAGVLSFLGYQWRSDVFQNYAASVHEHIDRTMQSEMAESVELLAQIRDEVQDQTGGEESEADISAQVGKGGEEQRNPYIVFPQRAEEIFWVDRNGRELPESREWRHEKLYLRTRTTAYEQIDRRQYFRVVRDGLHWNTPVGGVSKWFAQRIVSWDSGVKATVVAIPGDVDDVGDAGDVSGGPDAGHPAVFALIRRFRSFVFPMLYEPFGFAIVNRDGQVLYHVDDRRSLNENFVLESDNDRRLKDLIAQGQIGRHSGFYRGVPHNFYVHPLSGGLPWVSVVFQDATLDQTFNSEVLWTTFLHLFVYYIALVSVMLVVGWGFPSLRLPWLFPTEKAAIRCAVQLGSLTLTYLLALYVLTAPATAWILATVAPLTFGIIFLGAASKLEDLAQRRIGHWCIRVGTGVAGLVLALVIGGRARANQLTPVPGLEMLTWLDGGHPLFSIHFILMVALVFLAIAGLFSIPAWWNMFSEWIPKPLVPGKRGSYALVAAMVLLLIGVLPAVVTFTDATRLYAEMLIEHGQVSYAQTFTRHREALAREDVRLGWSIDGKWDWGDWADAGCRGAFQYEFFRLMPIDKLNKPVGDYGTWSRDALDADADLDSCVYPTEMQGKLLMPDHDRLRHLSSEHVWPTFTDQLTRWFPVYSHSSSGLRLAHPRNAGRSSESADFWSLIDIARDPQKWNSLGLMSASVPGLAWFQSGPASSNSSGDGEKSGGGNTATKLLPAVVSVHDPGGGADFFAIVTPMYPFVLNSLTANGWLAIILALCLVVVSGAVIYWLGLRVFAVKDIIDPFPVEDPAQNLTRDPGLYVYTGTAEQIRRAEEQLGNEIDEAGQPRFRRIGIKEVHGTRTFLHSIPTPHRQSSAEETANGLPSPKLSFVIRIDESWLTDGDKRSRLRKLARGLVVERACSLIVLSPVDLRYWIGEQAKPLGDSVRSSPILEEEYGRWNELDRYLRTFRLRDTEKTTASKRKWRERERDFLLRIGAAKALADNLGAVIDDDCDEEEGGLRLAAYATSEFRRVWVGSTPEEKLVLYHLACKHLVNPQEERPLRSLLRRGLIVHDQRLYIPSVAFRAFIKTAEPTERIRQLVAEGRAGYWNIVRMPLALILIALALLATGLGPDLAQNALWIAGGGTGLAHVGTLVQEQLAKLREARRIIV